MPTTKLKNAQLPDVIQSKTIDTSNDIDTTTTKLTITGGSNGQVLSTDGSGNLSWVTAGGGGGLGPSYIVTKTADESRVNTTTPSDDSHFSFAMTSGKYYFIEFNIIASRSSTATNPGIKFVIDGNSRGYYQINNVGTSYLCDNSTANSLSAFTIAGIPQSNKFWLAIYPNSNYTLKFRWSQTNNNATNSVTIHKGSKMLVYET